MVWIIGALLLLMSVEGSGFVIDAVGRRKEPKFAPSPSKRRNVAPSFDCRSTGVWAQGTFPWWAVNGEMTETEGVARSKQSYIKSIKCSNLAGIFDNQSEDGSISISLRPEMVSVTGETGTGKSLLISKLINVATGGKATASLVPQVGERASVAMSIQLFEPHLSWVQHELTAAGLPNLQETDGSARLTVRRVLEKEKRLSSSFQLNEKAVTMKAVRQVVAPLVVVVDTPGAASALAKPQIRLAVIDSAVNPAMLSEFKEARSRFNKARKTRAKLERDLAQVPPSISGDFDTDMLDHWVNELDEYQERVEETCTALSPRSPVDSSFAKAAEELSCLEWDDDSADMYDMLLQFRESLKEIDSNLASATQARNFLTELNTAESALSAIETARKHLIESVTNEESSSPMSEAAEQAHTCFNEVEEAIMKSVSALEDDKGLIPLLESARDCVPISMEDLDSVIAEWGVLARKHGVSPYSLPSCHFALQRELSGNVEAQIQLPKAKEAEQAALEDLNTLNGRLTSARQEVADRLSESVTNQLPSLGMNGMKLVCELKASVTDYEIGTANFIEGADFLLEEEDSMERRSISDGASSGEKARILLAMECGLPGAAGALCRASEKRTLPPISVVYDEIDAHIGGRAAVSVAKMLATQSGQVISITHSPSVAAAAETHLVVSKQLTSVQVPRRVPISITKVEGDLRWKELARMTSGDVVPDEAERFARALLRDGESWRGAKSR